MIFFAFSFIGSILGGLIARFQFDYTLFLKVPSGPFSTIVAFWPFIVALVLLLLAILWYQNIKNFRRGSKTSVARRRPGVNSIVFMGIVTVFAIVLLSAPYYFESFTKLQVPESTELPEEHRVETTLSVHGMDCSGCEGLVQRRVGSLEGVETVIASHVTEEVFIVYDRSKLSLEEISHIIEDSGYTVVFN